MSFLAYRHAGGRQSAQQRKSAACGGEGNDSLARCQRYPAGVVIVEPAHPALAGVGAAGADVRAQLLPDDSGSKKDSETLFMEPPQFHRALPPSAATVSLTSFRRSGRLSEKEPRGL